MLRLTYKYNNTNARMESVQLLYDQENRQVKSTLGFDGLNYIGQLLIYHENHIETKEIARSPSRVYVLRRLRLHLERNGVTSVLREIRPKRSGAKPE